MMRWLIRVLALPLLCAAQAPIRVDVNLVNVAFSVRDGGGNLVDNLTPDDFEVWEDNAPQNISFFARATDIPLNLGLVVDFSGSQDAFVKPHHKDIQAFLQSVFGPRDRAFLVCFGNHIRLVSGFSASPPDLIARLESFEKGRRDFPELGPPDEEREAGTGFYDAIYYSSTGMLADAASGRRALILFSDGEDNSSAHHMLDAIESSQANDVVLFSVRYTEIKRGKLNARNKYGMSVMQRISRDTGGADFDARQKGLADNLRQIGQQLRSSYELAYHSTNVQTPGEFHKILIRAKRPGLVVRAKTGYYSR